MQETIDILIIHLNGEAVLRNCINSIYKNSPQNINVFVLLNSIGDNSENMLKKDFSKVKIFKSEKRIGFAEGCNFLARKSNSDYIVFLNNDAFVEKGWLDELYNTMKRHPKCVACQPKIKSFFEKNKFEYAGAAGGYIDIYGFHFCRGRIFDSIEEDLRQYDDEKRIFWGCGVCLLVKKDFFIKNGMFDEDFFMYVEEADFCWRANLFDKEIWYSPKSVIYHIGSFSSKNYGKNKNLLNVRNDYYITRNHVLLLLKNYSLYSLIKILPLKFFLDFIAAIRFFPDKTFSFIKSYAYLPWFYVKRIKKKRNFIQAKRVLKDKELSNMMFKKSIALSYFLRNKKRFSEIKLG